MSSRVSSVAAVMLGLVVLSVLASWPLAALPGQRLPSAAEMPDLNVAIWLPWQVQEALRSGRSPWSAPGLLWPDGQDIALLVWNLGVQLLQAPFYLLWAPIPAYNLSLVAMGTLNGVGGFVLGRIVGGSRVAGLAGAALLGCSPFAWNELAQGRIEQGLLLWVALATAGLLQQRATPTRPVALLTGIAWGLAGLCYWFYGYFLLLLVLVLGGEALVRRRGDWLWGLGWSSGVSAVLAAPLAVPLVLRAAAQDSAYQQAAAGMHQELLRQVAMGASLGLEHLPLWLAAPPPYLRDVVPVTALLTLLLGLWGPLRRRSGWLSLVGLVGLLLALGPVLQRSPGVPVTIGEGTTFTLPLAGLQQILPGFSRLWWPYRFQVFSAVGAAGCGGALVAVLPLRLRWGVVVLLTGLALGELRLAQTWTHGRLVWDAPQRVEVPAFFTRLGTAPGEHPLLLLPLQGPTTGRVLWQAYHRQPTSAGLGDAEDFLLPSAVVARREDDAALRLLRELARRPPGQAAPEALPDLRAPLGALGYHYAVLWRDGPGAGATQEATYRRLLGEPEPTDSDAHILVWRLPTW